MEVTDIKKMLEAFLEAYNKCNSLEDLHVVNNRAQVFLCKLHREAKGPYAEAAEDILCQRASITKNKLNPQKTC